MTDEERIEHVESDDEGNGSKPSKEKGKLKGHDALKQELAEAREKAEEHLSDLKRERADFINFKKRVEQDMVSITQNANRALLLRMLPAIDDLERAINHLPSDPQGETAGWAEGVIKIKNKFKSILEAEGVTEMDTAGAVFDPSLHEAVGHEDGGEEGKILHEVQKGYKTKDKLLRAALVIVGKGPKKESEG